MIADAYTVRRVAEAVIGEDRVPTDTLAELIRAHGDPEHATAAGLEEADKPPESIEAAGIMLTPTEAAELADVLRDAEQHANETGRSVLARDVRHWRDVLARRLIGPGEGREWVEVEGETLNLTHAEARAWREEPAT